MDGNSLIPNDFVSAKSVTFPCLNVKLVPACKVIANDYNPNKVATEELELLAHSIMEDGMTQPCVAYYDVEIDKYIIVDGFHRYIVLTDMLKWDVLPLALIDKNVNDRIASTIRHNRARGKHKPDMMAILIEKLTNLDWDSHQIALHLGMEDEEVLRLKQVCGIA